MTKEPKEREPVHSPEQVRDISEQVYRYLLDRECGEGTAQRTDDDIAAGIPTHTGKPRVPIRDRAQLYDRLTRAYIKVLGIKP